MSERERERECMHQSLPVDVSGVSQCSCTKSCFYTVCPIRYKWRLAVHLTHPSPAAQTGSSLKWFSSVVQDAPPPFLYSRPAIILPFPWVLTPLHYLLHPVPSVHCCASAFCSMDLFLSCIFFYNLKAFFFFFFFMCVFSLHFTAAQEKRRERRD